LTELNLLKINIFIITIMSLFNKGLMRFRPSSLFNKAAGVGRSLFNKAPAALRSFSAGLGQAGNLLGQASSAASQPEVRALANKVGLGGAVGGFGGSAGSASALLGRASQASNPSSYSGMSPAAAASSAIERAKSLGGQAKQLFA
jgi:hypothetical protein